MLAKHRRRPPRPDHRPFRFVPLVTQAVSVQTIRQREEQHRRLRRIAQHVLSTGAHVVDQPLGDPGQGEDEGQVEEELQEGGPGQADAAAQRRRCPGSSTPRPPVAAVADHNVRAPAGCVEPFAAFAAALVRLLVLAHPAQRLRVGDVGDRRYASASPYPPAASRQPSGRTPYRLPSRATKICAFCLPKPGSSPTRRSSSAPVAGVRPEPGRVAVVPVDEDPADLLHPGRHRLREPVQRRRLGEDATSAVRVVPGQLRGRPARDRAAGPARTARRTPSTIGTCWSAPCRRGPRPQTGAGAGAAGASGSICAGGDGCLRDGEAG